MWEREGSLSALPLKRGWWMFKKTHRENSLIETFSKCAHILHSVPDFFTKRKWFGFLISEKNNLSLHCIFLIEF
jgi:hypothetical protein